MWEFVLGAFIFFLGIILGTNIRPIIIETDMHEKDELDGN